MICPSCTHENDAARRYCGQCGCNLKPVCVRCGFSNAAPDRFCGGCGLGISAYVAQAEDASLPALPRPTAAPPPVRLAAAAPVPVAAPADGGTARAPEMLTALDLEFLIERPRAPEAESALPKAHITQDDLDDLFEANS